MASRFGIVDEEGIDELKELSENENTKTSAEQFTNRNFFTMAAIAKRFSANHFQVILPGAITKLRKKCPLS